MIMQVFSNLIGNAVKYSQQSIAPVVEVSCNDHGSEIQYSIRDNGIGIKPADHHKVFELFARIEEVKEYEGTGVGLSIVKKIMDRHQGRIWIESNDPAGSVFHAAFKNTCSLKIHSWV